jgi:hypothetical protein
VLGLFTAGFTVTVFAVLALVGVRPWWSPQYAIPLLGMILGNTMTGIALGMDTLTQNAWKQRAVIENRLALGQTATAGRAAIEAEVLDSQTGERLAALVDGRAGRKVTGRFDKWKKWQDVRDACDYWSGQLRAELARQGVPAGSR